LGFDGELEVSALLEPKQLLIIEAPFENRLSNIASVAHQVAKECDDVQERRFPTAVWTNQRSEAADVLFDGFQATESACLNACKHVSLGWLSIIFASASQSSAWSCVVPRTRAARRPPRRGHQVESGRDIARTVIRPPSAERRFRRITVPHRDR